MIATAEEETQVKTNTGAAIAANDGTMMAVGTGAMTGTDIATITEENIILTTNKKIRTGIEKQEKEIKGAIEITKSMVDGLLRLLRIIPLMFTVIQPLLQKL